MNLKLEFASEKLEKQCRSVKEANSQIEQEKWTRPRGLFCDRCKNEKGTVANHYSTIE